MGTSAPSETIWTGETVALRAVVQADSQSIAAAVDDTEIKRWLDPPADYAHQVHRRAESRRRRDRGQVWAVTVDADFAGIVTIDKPEAQHGEIGFWLARHFRGRGVATTAVQMASRLAFADNGLEWLDARVAMGNTASLAVLRRSSFTLVETLSEGLPTGAGAVDCWVLRLPAGGQLSRRRQLD